MKQIGLTLLFALLLTLTYGQEKALLTGKIIDPNGKNVYLQGVKTGENGKPKQIYYDSAAIDVNNSFILEADLDSTVQVSFYDGKESAPLLLSPGDSVHLTLNTAMFDETLMYYGKGAEKNNTIAALALINEGYSKTVNDLIKVDRTDSTLIFQKNDELDQNYIKLVKSFQKEVPDFAAHGSVLIERKEMGSEMLKKYIRGKIEFRKKMEPLLGKEAIDFTGIDLAGNKTSLSDYKGKITVIDFWATWCGPCKAEFPAYKVLEEKYGDEINFVSVGVYCEEEAWKEMATKEGFSHNIFLSKKDAKHIKDYEVRTIPRYLVLNENFELIDADAPRPSSGKLEQYWIK